MGIELHTAFYLLTLSLFLWEVVCDNSRVFFPSSTRKAFFLSYESIFVRCLYDDEKRVGERRIPLHGHQARTKKASYNMTKIKLPKVTTTIKFRQA